MFEKLKAAISKARKRQKGREAEAKADASKTHNLSREIEELQKALKNATAEIQKLTNEIESAKAKGDKKAVARLEAKCTDVRGEIGDLTHKLRWKVGKRSSWRTRRRKAIKRARWWALRRTTLRKKLKDAEAEWHRTHKLTFESWMLNGCPEIHNTRLKKVITYMVVECHQYVTATTNGTHTPTSYHYHEEAADFGASTVSSMQTAAVKTEEKFGKGYFLEFFSPCDWWIKYGIEYPGYFPGHGDHCHTAVAK